MNSYSTLQHCVSASCRQVEPPTPNEIWYLVAIAASMPSALDLRDVVSLILNVGLTPGGDSDVNLDKRVITVSSAAGEHMRRVSFGERVCMMLYARLEGTGSSGFVLGATPNAVLCRVSRQLRVLSEHTCTNIVTLVAIQQAFAGRVLESVSDANFTVSPIECRYVPPKSCSVISSRHHLSVRVAQPRLADSS